MRQNRSQLIHLITVILTVLYFFILPLPCHCNIDPKFLSCVPKDCGDGQNISFPFYIDHQQENYCGSPRFDLSCNNKQPNINLFGNNYTIQKIHYNNHSLRVVNSEILEEPNSCFRPTRNLILYGDRFNFSFDYSSLFFFSNCTPNISSYKAALACSDEEDSRRVLVMFEKDPRFGDVSKLCSKWVKLPVEWDGDEGNYGNGEDWEFYLEVLRRGFLLNWTATSCGQCEQSGGRCGFDEKNYRFQCFCPDRPHLRQCSHGNKRLGLKLGLGIGIPFILIIGVVIFILHWCCKRKYRFSEALSKNNISDLSLNSYREGGGVYFGVPVFSYSELEEATNNFHESKELGDGGFGVVYHGILRDGREVAVKRLYEHNYKRVEQFRNEIEILTRLRHRNLVTLYGCTSRHSRELLLVYEYIPNGTVADHLHGDRAKPGSLTWPIRLSIAIETANALAYLHNSEIIHRDVKTNNILLDENFCVKVADFGLSRLFPTNVTHVSTAPQGTPGYVDPEYYHCYQLTTKSDVYSFGVVLIELITSLPAVDISRQRHEINLSYLAMTKIESGAYNELIDPSLGFESDIKIKKMTISVAELAFQCLQNDKEMRPTMEEVCESLKRIESGSSEEAEMIEEVNDNVGVVASVSRPPHSPESDEVVLLTKTLPPPSPVSVTANWVSRSTTPNTSG